MVLASRDGPGLADVVREIEAAGGVALAVPTDVTDGDAVARMVDAAVDAFGRLDWAFNNAGSGGKGGRVAELSLREWQASLDGYLTSVWWCMKHEINAMLEMGGGAIVNNASVDGKGAYPFPGGAAYAAAKHGVLGLTRSAALEYIGDGIRINAVCPGWVRTPRVERLLSVRPDLEARIREAGTHWPAGGAGGGGGRRRVVVLRRGVVRDRRSAGRRRRVPGLIGPGPAVHLPHPPAANGPFGSRYTTRPWNSVIWQSMSFSASVSTL